MEANDSEGAATAERRVGEKQVPQWGCGQRAETRPWRLPALPPHGIPGELPGAARVAPPAAVPGGRRTPASGETKDRRGGHTQRTPSLSGEGS